MAAHLKFLKEFVKEILLLTVNIFWSIVTFFIPKERKNIAGQLALITGGSEGIGRGIAFELAKCGCNIAIANRNLEKGEKTAEEIRRNFNVEAKAFKCDVARHEDVKKLRDDIKQSLGTVDILINNAAILMLDNSLLPGDEQIYQYGIDINLTSYFWTARTFLPDMVKQKRGHIVGISSASVQSPIPNAISYVTTKFANKGFMDSLREELYFYGFDKFIKTSVAYPSVVKTNDEFNKYVEEYYYEPLVQLDTLDNVCKTIVDGILKDKHAIYPSFVNAAMCYLSMFTPQSSKTRFLKNWLKKDKKEEFIKMKLKNNGLLEYYEN